MSSSLPQKAHSNADSLSLATRYSLLRGRHLSMEKYWNERHCNDKKHIEQLENRNSTLIQMLQIAQNEMNNLKKTIKLLQTKGTNPNNNNNVINNNEEENSTNTTNIDIPKKPSLIQNDLNVEYKSLLNIKINKSIQRENLFYELLRECLFLSDPYNIRVLLKRSKSRDNNNNNGDKTDSLSLQSSISNILKLRKQSDFECDCFAIHYLITYNLENNISSYSTRLILMRNSLIICGVGISSSSNNKNNKQLTTMENIELELYTIAGIYICNNDPYSYCNSMIIACSKDLTIAAHGINPLDVLLSKSTPKSTAYPNVTCYQFNIFSDSKKLIHSLTERLPDYVWHINNNTNDNDTSASPLLLLNMNMRNKQNRHNKSPSSSISPSQPQAAASTMVGRLGAGLVAGITGVVMDPIRGGQNDGMKGFLRGIASGISGVAIKPITHFRAPSSSSSTTVDEMKTDNDNNITNKPPRINLETKVDDRDNAEIVKSDSVTASTAITATSKEHIRSALIIPDSPLIPQASQESMSESGSVASSTITTNTLDSSRSGQDVDGMMMSSPNPMNNKTLIQSQIFQRHKSIQRQQYINNNNIVLNQNQNQMKNTTTDKK